VIRRLTFPLILLAPLIWLFRRALFAGEVLAFRDVGHFYYPLYQYVHRQWRNGIPLWNPLDGLGQPLLGDPTAAVLYPGKLVFAMPTSFGFCLTVYVLAHLLLAGWAAYVFSRELRANQNAAILAGLCYELSGQVLFQYCNLIYLVGAAWLPWALLFVYRIGNGKKTSQSVVGLSIVLCLMVLGGEPQMAMHVVLCGLVWAAIVFASGSRRREFHAGPRATRFIGYLIIACVVAVSLAAVQILPSQEWSKLSDRALRNRPRSCSELVLDYASNGELITVGFWKRDIPASEHADKTYDFSVGPWRWSELFWPNISGHFAPISTRWILALPGEGRMWTASLYLGLLPICLAVFRWRLFRGSRGVRWISWLTLLSALAALGEYGFGWLIDEIGFQAAGEHFQRSPIIKGFGGLYWFLTVTVPGYADFRYPGKWWTVASLGISVLAAKGWPLLWSRYRRQMLTRFAACSFLALGIMVLCRFAIVNSVPSNSAFGPFDEALSLQHFTATILHVMACGLGCLVLIRNKTKSTALALILLTTIELTVAQQPLILSAPNSTHVQNTSLHSTFWRESTPSYPPQFRESSSVDRIYEMREHDVRTLMPKHHLLHNKRQLNSISSMHCADFHSVWSALGEDHEQQLRRFFGADIQTDEPTAWLVFQWKRIPTVELNTLQEIEQRTKDVLLSDTAELIDHRPIAVVESDDEIPIPPLVASKHEVDLISTSPQRIEIRVITESPALLVLREQFYPGWKAKITNDGATRESTIHRTTRVMRGVFVPAGESTVVLQYKPRSFYLGASISIASWLALTAYVLRDFV